MKKTALLLVATIFAVATIQAQNPYPTYDRGGAWVKGHWSRSGRHREWVPGHWTTSEQARDEYKQIEVATDPKPAIGKFVDDHWSWQNGRLVYIYKHFAPVLPNESSFSAAALNARLTQPDGEDRVAQRGLGEM